MWWNMSCCGGIRVIMWWNMSNYVVEYEFVVEY